MLDFMEQYSYIIAQIFGVLAMLVAIIQFQCNNHKKIMLLMVLCSSLWCCHFLFLAKYTAAAANILNAVRSVVYSRRDKKRGLSNLIPALFIVAFFANGIITWENIWSIFPLIGSCFATVANWQINTKRLRALSLPVCVCWFVYDFVNQSLPGSVNEIFSFTSISVAVVRYDILKKPEKIKVK